MLLKPVVSVLVADVASGCSVDVLLGACVVRRLTVVASEVVVVVLEVVVMTAVVVVVAVLVVVAAVVVVVVVGGIVVVLGRTGQDKNSSIMSNSTQTRFYSGVASLHRLSSLQP